jgi:hypothetical protein
MANEAGQCLSYAILSMDNPFYFLSFPQQDSGFKYINKAVNAHSAIELPDSLHSQC